MMCNLHWCYTFCTGVTLFVLVLHLNCTALSQSESSNFFMYIITGLTRPRSFYIRFMNVILDDLCLQNRSAKLRIQTSLAQVDQNSIEDPRPQFNGAVKFSQRLFFSCSKQLFHCIEGNSFSFACKTHSNRPINETFYPFDTTERKLNKAA